MSFYDLFYNFWLTVFSGAPQLAIDSWLPLISMLSCVGSVMAFFIIIFKVVSKR